MGEAEEDGKKEEAHNNDEEGGVGAKDKKDKGDGEKKDKKTKKKKKSKEGKDPAKARTKLEKLEAKIEALLANQAKAPRDDADGKAVDYENMETEVQALVAKKEELLKLLNEEDHQEGEEGKDKKEKKKTKDKKEKNPEDKKDPAKLRAKLGKIETQMQELATRKEQVMKLLHEVENSAATSSC